uniref:ATP synthase complex subunit 8 n=3 Tax=Glyptosterninae TaxID=1128655 RepID=A0A0R7FFI8_9TELE|nr:ATP synthase F0 subunit 8 [Oreoglanis immaculatus]YP_009182835.1 ATP synthase F0 subunit 8 [Pareuchiloglanis longicauda]YP_009182848.1 ATP synthase F0 subunit 8 [Pareuchiloglanis macrotrema]YP_009630656.1 ATP synthase F0 subunit 8 [Euchiloglanis davidi]AKO72119.1 ATP synthase F0 subunit 8 [Oreoglanis immaculatus]AKO72155.1 ATP synthase F0 subunit 8 [Pareuchiloglanis longicauda]AKO72168.1 ATP synthase F0 subunit 8 [Pareuchiloglanis macrotrema]QBR55214.1 ATP synthase F0 subunit 8 [Euchilogl
MPQLNPDPWFMILALSWLIFLTVLPNKVLNYNFTNEITTPDTKKLESITWNWPWHQTYSTNS